MKLHLKESNNSTTVSEFIDEIKAVYHKYLPDSGCAVKLSKVLGKTLWIDFYLAGDNSEVANGYWVNDMFKISFSIYLPDDIELSSDMPENLTLEAHNSWIAVKPTSKYVAYDSKKIPFRKTTGDCKKILTTLDRYTKRLYDILVATYENDEVAPKFETLVKDKI